VVSVDREGMMDPGWEGCDNFDGGVPSGGPRIDPTDLPEKDPPLLKELKERIDSRVNCRSFLNGVIAALGGKLVPGFSVGTLLRNIMSATREEGVTDLGKGVYEEVNEDTIRVSKDGMAPHKYDWGSGTYRYYGDKLSVYLHAAFHLTSLLSKTGFRNLISSMALPGGK
jgi:hypothetical protein